MPLRIVLGVMAYMGRDDNRLAVPSAFARSLPDKITSAASMIRRKYEITARMNERDYPHVVELPAAGLKNREEIHKAPKKLSASFPSARWSMKRCQ